MIVAFAGGVGGAKLADGLYRVLPAESLAVIVNTADDFVLHGLSISPDLDTVLYTLAGIANPHTGWGIDGDTFTGLDMLARLGEPDWFRLGDRDIALHLTRTALLNQGLRLTEVTERFAAALAVHARLLPMCDERVSTIIQTAEGPLAFQEYFVKRGCRDTVAAIELEGIGEATLSPEVLDVLDGADAFIFCPSNPFVSIGPILAIPGMRRRIQERQVPLIIVSPIVAGQALKGPAAAMLASLGFESSVASIARLYADLAPVLVVDSADQGLMPALQDAGAIPLAAPTIMRSIDDRVALAGILLEYLEQEPRAQGGLHAARGLPARSAHRPLQTERSS